MGDREDQGSYGAIRTRYGGKRARSGPYPLRFPQGAPRYSEAVNRREYWDESSRPSWNPKIVTYVLDCQTPSKTKNGQTVYECQKCHEWFSKKADAQAAGGTFWITIDHKTDFAVYIWKTAKAVAVDGKIRITMKSARTAYNDTFNLKALCNSCNSSKNGYIP